MQTLIEHVSRFLSESIWLVDVLLRNHLQELTGHAAEVFFDVVEAQEAETSYEILHRIMKRIRKYPETFMTNSDFIEIGMRRSAARLHCFFREEAKDAYDLWIPHALHFSALPLIDGCFQRYTSNMHDSYKIISLALERSSQVLMNPELLIHLFCKEDGLGGLDILKTGLRLQSIMATIEMDIQLTVATSRLFSGDDMTKSESSNWNSMQHLIGNLLTVRWELDQFSRAIGKSEDLRVHIPWDVHLGLDLMSFLVDEEKNMLLMTPPQITLALELLNACIPSPCEKRQNETRVDDAFLSSFAMLKHLLKASIEGIFHPKDILTAESTTKFADLAQRLRVSLSKDERLKSLVVESECSTPSDGATIPIVSLENHKAKTKDDVHEFLAMIGCDGGKSSPMKSAKKPKKIVPERINSRGPSDNKTNEAANSIGEHFVAPYHHKGRVIMPATYNLDSDAREVLWQAYMEDKDRLVEMLGDSNYQQWHDESQTRSRRRKSGVENAFDAVFGKSLATDESQVHVMDGNIIEEKGVSILESSSVFPWQSLLSGILTYATKLFRQYKNDCLREKMLTLFVDNSMAKWSVNASLKSLYPDYSRSLWKCCCDSVSEHPLIGSLLYLSYQLHRVVNCTTRHTMVQLLSSFLEVIEAIGMQGGDKCTYRTIELRTKFATNPLTMSENMIRSCMSFPPLLGSSINSISARILPELCGLGRDTEVIIYSSSCCYTVWQSLRGNKKHPSWLSDEYDFYSHPVCASTIQAKCQFITSSLRVIARKIDQIGEESSNTISALLASSSLCATMSIDICKVMTTSNRRMKSKPSIDIVCEQKGMNLNLLSVISALCEIYCGLAEDWEEFLLEGISLDESSAPHAGAIAFGFDFTDACLAYLSAMREFHSPPKISDPVLERIESMIIESKHRLDTILHAIQKLDKDSNVYISIIEEIKAAPEIIVLDTSVGPGQPMAPTGVRQGKRMRDITNPFVKAILQESGRKDEDLLDDDLSDLEDFIVANPNTDYVDFIDKHFPLDNSQDSE